MKIVSNFYNKASIMIFYLKSGKSKNFSQGKKQNSEFSLCARFFYACLSYGRTLNSAFFKFEDKLSFSFFYGFTESALFPKKPYLYRINQFLQELDYWSFLMLCAHFPRTCFSSNSKNAELGEKFCFFSFHNQKIVLLLLSTSYLILVGIGSFDIY